MLEVLCYMAKLLILQILIITLLFTAVVVIYIIKCYLDLLFERGRKDE